MRKKQRNCVVCKSAFVVRENGARNIVCSEACARVRMGLGVSYVPCLDCGKQTKKVDGVDALCRYCYRLRQNTMNVTCRKCGISFNSRVKWAKWCESCVLKVRKEQSQQRCQRKRDGDASCCQKSGESRAIGSCGEHVFDAAMALHQIPCLRSTTENQKTWDRLIEIDGMPTYVQIKTARRYVREGCCKVSHAKSVKASGVLLAVVVLEDASVHVVTHDAICSDADRATIDVSHGGILSLWLTGASWRSEDAEANKVCRRRTSTEGKVVESVQPVAMEKTEGGVSEAESAMRDVPCMRTYLCC